MSLISFSAATVHCVGAQTKMIRHFAHAFHTFFPISIIVIAIIFFLSRSFHEYRRSAAKIK